MALITPEIAKERCFEVRRIELANGDHVFIRTPTAKDVLDLVDTPESEQPLVLLSRVLCHEGGELYYPNGNGVDELGNWPADLIMQLTNVELLELDTVSAKKN